MAEPTPGTPKRKRAPRRNYQRELDELQMYCKAHIEILEGMKETSAENFFTAGQLRAFQAVLVKLERKSNGA